MAPPSLYLHDLSGEAVRHAAILTSVLSGIWLLWSGHDEPLILGLGAGSLLFVVWLSSRMKILDDESVPISLDYLRLAAYLPWLALEIVKANVDVARRIVTIGKLPISPRMIRVPTSQRSDLAKTLYANSITLTPGTVSVDVRDGQVLVHALHAEAAAGVETGDMDRRCAEVEGTSA